MTPRDKNIFKQIIFFFWTDVVSSCSEFVPLKVKSHIQLWIKKIKVDWEKKNSLKINRY